jgi:hypothetical protein
MRATPKHRSLSAVATAAVALTLVAAWPVAAQQSAFLMGLL